MCAGSAWRKICGGFSAGALILVSVCGCDTGGGGTAGKDSSGGNSTSTNLLGDPDCNDNNACTDDAWVDHACVHTPNDANVCDDGLWCNGAETCQGGVCLPGTPPSCDDGVVCTVDACNEDTDQCKHTPNSALCDNGQFCDGAEVCNATLGCQPDGDPCPGRVCDEEHDVCGEIKCDNGHALFLPGQQVGTIAAPVIKEASGLAASRRHLGVLWTHNDSGGENVVYAIAINGTLLGTYTFGSESIWDTEDIAIGPGPTPGVDYLYWADIGDNGNVRSSIVIRRAPEPFVNLNQNPVTETLSGVDLIALQYPTGEHAPSEKDAETMFVDLVMRDIYVVTKRAVPNKVYRASYPQSTGSTTTLEWVANLPPEFNGTPGSWDGGPTGGDMSPDGSLLVIRQYSWKTPAAAVWYRPAGSSVASVFAGQYCAVVLQADGAGEAVGWDPDGLGFYTTEDETTNAPIRYYARDAN